MTPRLEPIDRPRGGYLRVAYWVAARQFGKVIGPLRVIYARKPRLLGLAVRIQREMAHGLSLDPALRLLLQVQVSQLNGCTFCQDMAQAQALRARLGTERLAELSDFRTSAHFTEREKAALAYADEVTRTRTASDATFAELRRHFDDTEIVEITWLNAAENYFNLLAHPLGIGSDSLQSIAARRVAG